MTIRAVTPEPEPEFEPDLDDATALATHTTTPPRTPSRSTIRSSSRWDLLGRSSPEPTAAPTPSSPEKSRSILDRASMAAAAQLADLNISRAKSRSPTERMRYSRTGASSPEDTRFDVGSPSYVTRHRYGVLETGTVPTSVGYPSTQAVQLQNPTTRPQTGKSSRHRLLRPSASITTLQQQSSFRSGAFADQPAPTSPVNADFDTLVRLMKKVRGRMDGYVEFRLGEHKVWTKGYCQIDIGTGALLYQHDENNPISPPHVIVPDLRGCHVRSSAEDEGMIDLSTHSLKIEMKLRPLSVQQYDQWLAAFLCWSPIRPAGAQNKRVRSQMPVLAKEKRRRNSDATVQNRGDATIIKVGKMLLWRPVAGPTMPPTGNHKSSSKTKSLQGVAWQSISCTLQENGEFRLHRDLDSQILAVVQLSQLSRCAVQQLDPSILDQDFCIAIYPQYTPNASNPTQLRPVYLGIDSRILFEVWFVLLRAFTMPELYGPSAPPSGLGAIMAGAASESRNPGTLADSYRIQRSLYLRIVEAKISMNPHNERESSLDCYAEVVLDGEARAKTMVRTKTHNPFWREDYEFPDLPTVLTDIAVVLKQRDPRTRSKANGGGTVTGSGGFGGGLGGVSLPGSNDTIIGRVDVRLDRLVKNEFEQWLPLINIRRDGSDEQIGEMYLRAETEELIVLMGSEYKVLSDVCPPSLVLVLSTPMSDGIHCTVAPPIQFWNHITHCTSDHGLEEISRYSAPDLPGQQQSERMADGPCRR